MEEHIDTDGEEESARVLVVAVDTEEADDADVLVSAHERQADVPLVAAGIVLEWFFLVDGTDFRFSGKKAAFHHIHGKISHERRFETERRRTGDRALRVHEVNDHAVDAERWLSPM